MPYPVKRIKARNSDKFPDIVLHYRLNPWLAYPVALSCVDLGLFYRKRAVVFGAPITLLSWSPAIV